MFAIVKTGGKQYKVCCGDTIRVEKIAAGVGAEVSFEEVLMVVDDSNKAQVGNPLLSNAKVTGEVTKQAKHPKVIIFKSKRRKGYRRKTGHRQLFTEVKIKQILV